MNFGVNKWAVPCDGIQECSGKEDESKCSIPNWYLYGAVSIGILVITIALFAVLKKTMEKYQQQIVKGDFKISKNLKQT